jgi:hypothetical protein
MSEASKLNISISAGQEGRPKRIIKQVTLARVIQWIESHGHDEYTTKGLVELASRYPTAALPSFQKNYQILLNRVRAKRNQEQGGSNGSAIEEESGVERKPVSLDEILGSEEGAQG